MTTVSLIHLHKGFSDGTVAVEDLSLEIADGEFLTLLGPSGCGKTTTLWMIAGLEAPTGGEIRFAERRVDGLPPAQRNIAMVFQSYALYPHMTVRQNLEYPLKKHGVPRDQRRRRSNDVARMLQIEPLLERRPKQLSGGQQQRVALGRALIRDPKVFLLDEPLSNLDATLRTQLRAELIQLHQRIRKTMIYVTHDQVEAMTMSTRIAVLHQGRLQQVGTPSEVYRAPSNRFVASFVGTPAMNFLQGKICEDGTRIAIVGIDLPIILPPNRASALHALSPPGQVLVGMRPEDILVGAGSANARILLVEPLGHEALVYLHLGGQTVISRVSSELSLRPHDVAAVDFRTAHLHLFDPATGTRLPC
jgi:multiple sugar transport system ATP-binding protein